MSSRGGSAGPPMRRGGPTRRGAFRPPCGWAQHLRRKIAALQAERERGLVGIGEEEYVVARSLGIEVDPCASREADPLDERAVPVPDEHDERAPRFRVAELDIDLAGRRGEPHLEADRRLRLENEESRKVPERGRHGVPTPRVRKAVAFFGWSAMGDAGWKGPQGLGPRRPAPHQKLK